MTVVFAFFAGAATGAVVVVAGAVVAAAVVAAVAAPVAMNPATAMDVRTLAIRIVVTPLGAPPNMDS